MTVYVVHMKPSDEKDGGVIVKGRPEQLLVQPHLGENIVQDGWEQTLLHYENLGSLREEWARAQELAKEMTGYLRLENMCEVLICPPVIDGSSGVFTDIFGQVSHSRQRRILKQVVINTKNLAIGCPTFFCSPELPGKMLESSVGLYNILMGPISLLEAKEPFAYYGLEEKRPFSIDHQREIHEYCLRLFNEARHWREHYA